jgi:hypothetical protein
MPRKTSIRLAPAALATSVSFALGAALIGRRA